MDKFVMQLPVKPYWLNQAFGGNKATYAQFGLDGHNGLDLMAGYGQPIYAAHEGIANYEVDNSQGHGVDVQSTEPYDMGPHGQAYAKTRYWHMVDPKVDPKFASPIYGKKNVRVKVGDIIGYADSTGFSTGDHLHFGLKPQGKNSKGNYYNLFPTNGYKGAVDPLPFLANVPPPPKPSKYIFGRDLTVGSEGEDVRELQIYLNKSGYTVAYWGAGSSGHETAYFGPRTKQALAKFQKDKGINPPQGYFGPITRNYVNTHG